MSALVELQMTCPFCGKPSSIVVDKERFERWQAGEHVQLVWPELTPGERETLISGAHEACFDRAFAPEPEKSTEGW